jgi:tRNA pseudouridine38-40 synthase
MPCWKLKIEYDGTRYSGWQEQKNSRTIAGEIRKAASAQLRDDVRLEGSGRTDAGVHALEQVAKLTSRKAIKPEILRQSINDALPKDIHILSVEPIKENFHPRHDALRRYYLYQISTRRTAFAKAYVWWIKDSLDWHAMRDAASYLPGRHNFERFCERRGDEKSTIVVVERAEIGISGDLILFRIGASHFLWKMVRRLAGMLVETGRGNLTPDDFGNLVASSSLPQRLNRLAIPAATAPPAGLFLEKVAYDDSDDPVELVPAIPVRSLALTKTSRKPDQAKFL